MTQQQKEILRYLGNHESISVRECVIELGFVDLRKRISELRKKGYPIADITDQAKNRYGRTVWFKRYYIEGGKNGGRSEN